MSLISWLELLAELARPPLCPVEGFGDLTGFATTDIGSATCEPPGFVFRNHKRLLAGPNAQVDAHGSLPACLRAGCDAAGSQQCKNLDDGLKLLHVYALSDVLFC
eukprot:139629_1